MGFEMGQQKHLGLPRKAQINEPVISSSPLHDSSHSLSLFLSKPSPAMFSIGVFQSPPQFTITPPNTIVKPIIFHHNSYHIHLSVPQSRIVLCASSSKIQTKGLVEVDDIDEEEDDGEFEDEFEEFDEGEGEGEEMIVPLANMRSWLQNKPRGFGEGKVYDTSVEDKLADEIEHSRVAQLANLNKLKNNPEQPQSKKQLLLKKQKESEDVPIGIRVRLANLPKKKNIHRDLQHAFKGVPGMIKIVPAVAGNKKTREPICKGIAFVYFNSQNQASQFLEKFSKEKIAFGKVQKQIKYEIVNSSSLDCQETVDRRIHVPQLAVLSSEKSSALKSTYTSSVAIASQIETLAVEDKGKGETVTATLEDTKESLENLIASVPSDEEDTIHPNEKNTRTSDSTSVGESTSNKKQAKIKGKGTKIVDIKKKRKLSIPGSANRLKGKEKNVLTDVFSKYGGQKGQVVIQEQT